MCNGNDDSDVDWDDTVDSEERRGELDNDDVSDLNISVDADADADADEIELRRRGIEESIFIGYASWGVLRRLRGPRQKLADSRQSPKMKIISSSNHLSFHLNTF